MLNKLMETRERKAGNKKTQRFTTKTAREEKQLTEEWTLKDLNAEKETSVVKRRSRRQQREKENRKENHHGKLCVCFNFFL